MNHEYYMSLALEEAKKAYLNKEVPIGAIIVKDGKVVGKGFNNREATKSAMSHAELIAIQRANEELGSWRLDSCDLYVTIEPCPMCSGAIIQSRIRNVYYGAKDPKAGTHVSILNLFEYPFNHKVKIEGGILAEECRNLMSDFFKELRVKKN
jgi:tRNA(adenine34) deaminase